MIQNVDLNENSNLFTVSVILIAGVGGMALTFGVIPLKSVAVALILGILVNLLTGKARKQAAEEKSKTEE